ncbi:MAG: hypothetical protein IPP77_04285 [Bacteroidetes bacterium]|nr:hypothetical protein [Bacteroidota bacterium]
MKTINNYQVLLYIVVMFISVGGHAQYAHYGDAFSPALGLEAQSPEVSELIANYHLEKANDAHYLSKEGVELVLKDGLLTSVRLYQNSPAYGKFIAVLPRQVKFGMSAGEIKALLGKPTVNYSSSGYSEFETDGKILSCWFEKGKLSQVSVSLK